MDHLYKSHDQDSLLEHRLRNRLTLLRNSIKKSENHYFSSQRREEKRKKQQLERIEEKHRLYQLIQANRQEELIKSTQRLLTHSISPSSIVEKLDFLRQVHHISALHQKTHSLLKKQEIEQSNQLYRENAQKIKQFLKYQKLALQRRNHEKKQEKREERLEEKEKREKQKKQEELDRNHRIEQLKSHETEYFYLFSWLSRKQEENLLASQETSRSIEEKQEELKQFQCDEEKRFQMNQSLYYRYIQWKRQENSIENHLQWEKKLLDQQQREMKEIENYQSMKKMIHSKRLKEDTMILPVQLTELAYMEQQKEREKIAAAQTSPGGGGGGAANGEKAGEEEKGGNSTISSPKSSSVLSSPTNRHYFSSQSQKGASSAFATVTKGFSPRNQAFPPKSPKPSNPQENQENPSNHPNNNNQTILNTGRKGKLKIALKKLSSSSSEPEKQEEKQGNPLLAEESPGPALSQASSTTSLHSEAGGKRGISIKIRRSREVSRQNSEKSLAALPSSSILDTTELNETRHASAMESTLNLSNVSEIPLLASP